MKLRVMKLVGVAVLVLPLAASSLNAQLSMEGTWNQLTTSGGPPRDRGWQSAIYDPVARRMVIFGGWSGSLYNSLNDTWTLDLSTNTWSQVSTTGGPPATRAGHVGVYDSSRHRMVVYGGHNWWTSWRNDTWALDLSSNTWTQLSTTGGPPPVRYGHRGFYDRARDRFTIFGGYAGGSSNRNDTWSLDLSTLVWSEITTTGGPPSPRHSFAAAYDPGNDRFVIAGGTWGLADAWVLYLDSHTWTQVSSAPQTFYAVGSAFDDETGWMIVVGGQHGMPPESNALVYDVWNNRWLLVEVASPTPPERGNEVPSAIFDPVGQRTIMFGGGTSLSATFNDTWGLVLNRSPDCCTGDLDQDGDVDMGDFAIFQRNFAGPLP